MKIEHDGNEIEIDTTKPIMIDGVPIHPHGIDVLSPYKQDGTDKYILTSWDADGEPVLHTILKGTHNNCHRCKDNYISSVLNFMKEQP